jgi:8-oxo-dGTP pyrophosphatase MutT (NUDIX family)
VPSTGKPIHDLGPVILGVEVYLEHDGKFLMHRRAADKPRWPGALLGPGGRIDEGEDVIASAVREVEEETGVTLEPGQVELKAVAIHHWRDRVETWVAFICLAKLTADPPKIRDSNEGTSLWMTRAEIDSADKVFKPAKYYFDHVLGNRPGILYANLEWDNGELVAEHSKTLV